MTQLKYKTIQSRNALNRRAWTYIIVEGKYQEHMYDPDYYLGHTNLRNQYPKRWEWKVTSPKSHRWGRHDKFPEDSSFIPSEFVNGDKVDVEGWANRCKELESKGWEHGYRDVFYTAKPGGWCDTLDELFKEIQAYMDLYGDKGIDIIDHDLANEDWGWNGVTYSNFGLVPTREEKLTKLPHSWNVGYMLTMGKRLMDYKEPGRIEQWLDLQLEEQIKELKEDSNEAKEKMKEYFQQRNQEEKEELEYAN